MCGGLGTTVWSERHLQLLPEFTLWKVKKKFQIKSNGCQECCPCYELVNLFRNKLNCQELALDQLLCFLFSDLGRLCCVGWKRKVTKEGQRSQRTQ